MTIKELLIRNAATALIVVTTGIENPQTAPKIFECFTPGEEHSYMYMPVADATPLFEEGVDEHQAATLWQLSQDGVTGFVYDVKPNQMCGVREQ